MARTERDGPPVEGAETAYCRESASGSYRATGRGGCRVGTPTAPTRSPAQSGHPLSGVLASRGVTRFLSTHLDPNIFQFDGVQSKGKGSKSALENLLQDLGMRGFES